MLFSKHWLMRRKSIARGANRSEDPTHHPARGFVPASRWQLWQRSFATTFGGGTISYVRVAIARARG